MSANLMWEPAKREAKSLPDELKFVLRDKCGLTSERMKFGEGNIPYLEGLRDAGIKGAEELLEAIEKHGAVEGWLEY
jgi:hypothetical protein